VYKVSKLIVFLNGVIGSGKNECASYLVSKHNFSQYAFGDKIRDGLYTLNPTVKEDGDYCGYSSLRSLVDHYGWDYCKRNVPEVRRLLQVFGTEAGRELHGNSCWSKLVFSQIVKNLNDVVISDLRFASEFKYFRDLLCGYTPIIIHVTKPGIIKEETHVSESMDVVTEFPGHVIELVNDGTIEDLHSKIDAIMFGLVLDKVGASKTELTKRA